MIDYDDIPDAEWSLSRIDIRNIIDKYPDKVVDIIGLIFILTFVIISSFPQY